MFDPVSWTELSWQYGPFFLALLFLMVITRWAYKIYRRANLRAEPPASPEEKRTYRYYFIATAAFGMMLVIVSVVWWATHQPSTYIFRGEVMGLNDYEDVFCEEFYCRQTKVPMADGEGYDIKRWHFVFLQDNPIQENRTFDVSYRKGRGSAWENFTLDYIPCPIAKYRIVWDSLAERNSLKIIYPAPPPAQDNGSAFLFNTAYAQDRPQVMEKAFPLKEKKMDYVEFERSTENLVRLLQDERTDVGRKIEVLDAVREMDDERFRVFVESSTPKEPMLLTLLDLGRHTDRELAYKSRRLLATRANLPAELKRMLLSENPKMREMAESIVFRIEPPRAREIVDKMTADENIPGIDTLQQKLASGHVSRVLIPTGSERGDRYYVRASWDQEDRNLVDCLTQLFHRELMSKRTLEEEKEIMAGREERLVYWYSKKWALDMASKIEQCGAEASFVGL
jgi:hypothetical protein